MEKCFLLGERNREGYLSWAETGEEEKEKEPTFEVYESQISYLNKTYFLKIKPFEITIEEERAAHKSRKGNYLVHLFDGKTYKTFGMYKNGRLKWKSTAPNIVDEVMLEIVSDSIEDFEGGDEW